MMMPGFFCSRFAILSTLALGGALLALCGCSSDPASFACPGAAILADAATRPVLKAGSDATDPAAVLYTVRMMTIGTSCSLDRRLGVTNSDVTLTFQASRAPSGQAAHYVVPYFLAINQGDRVINKRMFNIQVDFAPGAAGVRAQTAVNNTTLKLENGRLPTDYQFLAGFQLSEAEQAYLKRVGPYTP
ncbi:MAG: hypothetical protein JO256_09525 [Alphaproteobacteria bacterium]|nr:hypothetical protein [Alphaproteobacteria bacterium]